MAETSDTILIMWNEIWHDLGPLVGVVVGALLTPWITWRWQHRQWSLDNRKQEYRELLDGLHRATEEIIRQRPNAAAGWNPRVADAAWIGTRLVQNRIFIARAIRSSQIPEDWQKIVNVAQWESGEPKIRIGEHEYLYTTGAICLLRASLEEKLLEIAKRDLHL